MSVRILVGDALERLCELPDASARCCVTSPPYWRQRDYGMAEQIGLEQTPEEYIAELVSVFRSVHRVLADDGSCWINIGDKWASGGGGSFMAERSEAWAHVKHNKGWRSPPPGYKDKDLVGLPWMLAFALRADGWYLRQCNIWAKPNGMPESVRDRTTASHEYVLHLTKRNDYFYNANAARTPSQPSSETRLAQDVDGQAGSDRANGGAKANGTMKAVRRSDKQRGHGRKHAGFNQMAAGANLRSVWWIAPAQYREGHFAVMPDALAEICIACGSEKGDTILDPFGGAGTTGLVADQMGRNAVLIELNPEYAQMAERRISSDAPLFAYAAIDAARGAGIPEEQP